MRILCDILLEFLKVKSASLKVIITTRIQEIFPPREFLIEVTSKEDTCFSSVNDGR